MTISVIIPTFNRAALLRETLDSVLAQTARPADEIIVIDDGSTDDTRNVVAGYASGGVAYVYQENAFLGAARNAGQAQATGEAVLFLDSDDRLRGDNALARLEALLAAAPSAALAYGRAAVIEGTTGRPTGRRVEIADFDGDGAAVWPRLAEHNFIVSAGCALVRRSHLERAGAWDTNLKGVEDWDMWLRLAEGAPFVRVAGEPTLEYRVHAGSMSQDRPQMDAMERALLRKHTERNAHDAGRSAHLRRLLAARAGDAGRREARRHRLLRGLLARAGVAELYRRVPLVLRLRLRALLGLRRHG